MEKYFCNYNQSLSLKELGFDMPCLMYIDDEEDLINDDTAEWIGAVKCPLKSQVFEWFRKKHRLEPNIIFREYYYEDGDKNVYEVNIESNINSDFCLNITPLEGFKSYEEAESACIDKLIEIVKNK